MVVSLLVDYIHLPLFSTGKPVQVIDCECEQVRRYIDLAKLVIWKSPDKISSQYKSTILRLYLKLHQLLLLRWFSSPQNPLVDLVLNLHFPKSKSWCPSQIKFHLRIQSVRMTRSLCRCSVCMSTVHFSCTSVLISMTINCIDRRITTWLRLIFLYSSIHLIMIDLIASIISPIESLNAAAKWSDWITYWPSAILTDGWRAVRIEECEE